MYKIKLKKHFFGTFLALLIIFGGVTVSAAGWQQDELGWWYEFDDKSYPSSAWERIEENWYYFDQEGYMAVGWNEIGGKLYYFYADGTMAHDTWINGTFYLGSDGAMQQNISTDNSIFQYYGDMTAFDVDIENLGEDGYRVKDRSEFIKDNGSEYELQGDIRSLDYLYLRGRIPAVMHISKNAVIHSENAFHFGDYTMEEYVSLYDEDPGVLGGLITDMKANEEGVIVEATFIFAG